MSAVVSFRSLAEMFSGAKIHIKSQFPDIKLKIICRFDENNSLNICVYD